MWKCFSLIMVILQLISSTWPNEYISLDFIFLTCSFLTCKMKRTELDNSNFPFTLKLYLYLPLHYENGTKKRFYNPFVKIFLPCSTKSMSSDWMCTMVQFSENKKYHFQKGKQDEVRVSNSEITFCLTHIHGFLRIYLQQRKRTST